MNLPTEIREFQRLKAALRSDVREATINAARRGLVRDLAICPECGGKDNGRDGYASCDTCDDAGLIPVAMEVHADFRPTFFMRLKARIMIEAHRL